MKRLSHAVALAAVTLAAMAGGCKKEEAKPVPTPAEPKAADAPAPPPAEPGAVQPAAPAAAQAPEAGAATPAVPAQPIAPADPGKRPTSITDAHIAIADRIIAATNKFADLLDAASSDCRKATAVIRKSGGEMKAAMGEAETLQVQLNSDPAAMQWFQKAYGPRMMGAINKLGFVVGQCRKDKDFEVAFKELDIGGSRQEPKMTNTPPTPPEAPPAMPPGTPATATPSPDR
jgi:hypothetical protein